MEPGEQKFLWTVFSEDAKVVNSRAAQPGKLCSRHDAGKGGGDLPRALAGKTA
jgi:hypothetical protein